MTPSSKSLLQRRSNIFATFQSILDGMLVIALTYGLTMYKFGYFPTLYLVFCIVLIAFMSITYDRFGVYRHNGGFTQKSILILKAWTITFGILLTIAFLTKTSTLFSRQFLTTFFVSGAIGQLFLHILSRYLLIRVKSGQHVSNVLLIGTGKLTNFLYNKINDNPWIPEIVIGTVTSEHNNSESIRSTVTDEGPEPPILGCLDDVIQLVDKHIIKEVYIAVPLDSSPVIEELYFELLDKNVDVHWAPNIFALNLINHSVKELAGIPIITLSETPLVGTNLALKILEDRVLAVIIVTLISPILILASLAIKLDSSGPVFFRQERTGWDGRVFRIWKFRTMKVHKEESGFIKQATRNDPRVTRVGKFLRRTSMDELPQIFNVLDGSMSLVGPRPHAISHNIEYSKQIVAYLARHRIKPGITGLAQVRGFRGETKDIDLMRERVNSDLEYINNWSISLDISILLRTFLILFKNNAY
jgi:putative colanic acid biosynthesis UDP-glucose lipid carrier transferase